MLSRLEEHLSDLATGFRGQFDALEGRQAAHGDQLRLPWLAGRFNCRDVHRLAWSSELLNLLVNRKTLVRTERHYDEKRGLSMISMRFRNMIQFLGKQTVRKFRDSCSNAIRIAGGLQQPGRMINARA